MKNTRIYILDRNYKLCPIGIIGEIYVAGDCVSKGYLNMVEFTNTKFINDPFLPNSKMYQTGLLDGLMKY